MDESNEPQTIAKSAHPGWLSPQVAAVVVAAIISAVAGLAAAVISNRSETKSSTEQLAKRIAAALEANDRLEAEVQLLRDHDKKSTQDLAVVASSVEAVETKIQNILSRPNAPTAKVEHIVNPLLGVSTSTQALGIRWHYLGSTVQDGVLAVKLAVDCDEPAEVMVRATFLPTLVTLANGESVSSGRVEFANGSAGDVTIPLAPSVRTDFTIVFPNKKFSNDAKVAAIQITADRKGDRISGDTTVVLAPSR